MLIQKLLLQFNVQIICFTELNFFANFRLEFQKFSIIKTFFFSQNVRTCISSGIPQIFFQVSLTLESIWGRFFAIIWYLKWTLAVLYNIGELPSRPKDRGGSMVMMTTTTGTNICQKNCETNAVTLRFALANICK
jgi:hypothetical protein